MKATLLIPVILLASAHSWAQRPMQPVVPARPVQPIVPPQRPSPPNNQFIGDNLILPGGPTTNTANTNATNTSQFAPGNAVPAEPTNNIPEATNTVSPEMARALGITNRLSFMAPSQVQAVTLVQGGLDDLQHLADSVSGASSIQQIIHENPHVAQQLQTVSARIINLARGPDRPSNDSVDRLAEDLLRACSHTHLDRDGQLVLSVVINLVVNCQNLPAAQVESSVNNALIVLRSAGVPPAVCNIVGCDLNSIALEIRPNLGI